MESGKIDRRRRYTLSVIREAFFALLAEVGFAKMTVADICRCADINRGTFYLHYEDTYPQRDYLIDQAVAAAPGSRFEVTARGDCVVFEFDMGGNEMPFPHVWIGVDDVKVEAELTA